MMALRIRKATKKERTAALKSPHSIRFAKWLRVGQSRQHPFGHVLMSLHQVANVIICVFIS
jgi:hypothetical protein